MLLRSIKYVDHPSFHAAIVAGSGNVLSVSEGYREGFCVCALLTSSEDPLDRSVVASSFLRS